MKNQRLSVSECVNLINQTLDYTWYDLIVEGEVAGLSFNQGKFVFFDLKDNDSIIGCFSMIWQIPKGIEDGMKVSIRANPRLTQKGRFSLTVRELEVIGDGDLAKNFEILKSRLEKDGLFDPARKRKLPEFPEKIAVISSLGAAGYGDFIKILSSRWGGVEVDVFDVQVQGESAPAKIINAINEANYSDRDYEVIVIVRGGGSADDLQAFNDEELAREVARSKIPVISGIGHERDITLVDLIADVRASTPSNVAEILVPNKKDFIDSLSSKLALMSEAIGNNIERSRDHKDRLLLTMFDLLEVAIERNIMIHKKSVKTLEAYDPSRILRRGYSIVRGDIASPGEIIDIETDKFNVKAEVKNVDKK